MLAATHPPALTIEHRVFAARTSAEWDRLAADRATAEERAVFVLAAPAAPMGDGVLWGFVRRGHTMADLGWWWIHRVVEGTPAERALFDEVAAWAAGRGATMLATAADDHREQASLLRAGFVHHGLAADGHRPVLTRRAVATELVV
jgi:hypothetical protein